MKKWNIALGYYQEHSTAHAVIKELKRKKFTRFATIRNSKEGGIKVKRCLGFSMIDKDVVEEFKNRVIVDEILVIAQVSQSQVRDVLAILRQVKSGHPVTFLLRTEELEEGNVEIQSEPATLEQLSQDARLLAVSLQNVGKSHGFRPSLLKSFRKKSDILHQLRSDIADAEFIEQTIPLSAEWLLDNMYVLEGSIEDVKLNLPKSYYRSLPKLSDGHLSGYPRIYALAIELVRHTAGGLTQESITTFLKSYQTEYPLTLGELWAFPLMLRYRLIEWIEFLAVHVDNRMREGELASFWGNRLLYAARHDPGKLDDFLSDLFNQTHISSHFAEELIDHLFDEENILPIVRKRLEERFARPLADILHQEHIHETSEQVIFSNSVRSLITLSQLSWRDILETVSPVDAILSQDADGVYSKMDFTTRNSYRDVVEDIARGTHKSEVEIAERALTLSLKGIKDFERHIGYYLVDDGRPLLERSVRYRPGFISWMRRWITTHAAVVYLGGIALLTMLLEALVLFLLIRSGAGPLQTTMFGLLALAPASELSMQFVHLLLIMVLPSPLRPKMCYEKGIPEADKTLVVVPMLLTPESIKDEIDRLEVRYLANTDPQIVFGLFGDFTDAAQQQTEGDAALLATAVDAINALEQKYGPGKFFLFHRKRVWSKCENAWIGWERKRGKLECLNCYLMGEELPENIVYAGQADALKGVRYVITLDADTQLPKDQARALIEVLSHPLNRPYLNTAKNALVRGYTIIQPRVGTDFINSKASWFSRIFSEPTAADPYTLAISNIHQDLVKEASYHGKGIYDVEAFHSILSHHFPEEHLLSHDLIEGAYARVGFASNVCLLDMHPKDYLSWAKRQHRWIRGDWQNCDWIMGHVPLAMGKMEANTLSWLSRWKIFDNLRRSLVPLSLLLLLTLGWTVSFTQGIWTALAWIVLLLPFISLCLSKLIAYSNAVIKSSLVDINILILRTLITISMLPYEAYISLDAICRVAFRRLFSRRNLLQWTASDNVQDTISSHRTFVLQLGLVSIFALALFGYLIYTHPQTAKLALPFCLLWMAAPFTVYMIDRPLEKPLDKDITDDDRRMLRKIARKTWRYFDELVGLKTHWLPPDNYQLALNIEVAQRTSPTNIGMWLTAALSAYDMRYITCDTLIDKMLNTIQELKTLERYQGHFLNWYNIQTLDPLFPRYVSTVDSGNLLACLWTLMQGLDEVISSPMVPSDALSGINDTYEIVQESKGAPKNEELSFLLKSETDTPVSFMTSVRKALSLVKELPAASPSDPYWQKQIEEQLNNAESIVSRYFTWVHVLNSISHDQLIMIDTNAPKWKETALAWNPSLKSLAAAPWIPALADLVAATQRPDLPADIKGWGRKLNDSIENARWLAGEKMGLVNQIDQAIALFSQEMNLKFLYNADRKLFAIGYNVDERRLDSSYYDLLASEARIASLVGIAKEDVPMDHWWALGRQYGIVHGRKVLLSWGGTMFEYLMPTIFNRQYPDSLLGDACAAAVACQIAYGQRRGIPWGISESAFSAIDSHKIYQYKSFGVPGLGLKRGLEDDLVISLYSTALALAVDPVAALRNLRKLESGRHVNLMGPYGYYESMDFTRQRSPEGERGVIVYVYMAHHQGMSLASIDNILTNGAMIKRFHKDPRIAGVGSLLYERIPYSIPVKVIGGRQPPPMRRLEPFSQSPIMGVVETPESATPKINLLSNGNYSVMITNTGAGYSRWRDLDIYRWRADTTRDSWGSYCYVKDMKSNKVWSTTFQPTETAGKEYSANFKADKSEFKRKDHQIETITEVVVSPEDNAEVRLITLINRSEEVHSIELTSYLELALAPHAADRAHPCFNKLFIETEALPDQSALLAFRRKRSPDDPSIWSVHILTANTALSESVQYETDRSRFVGRGRSINRPQALEEDLSKTVGTVLDPIFSLRGRLNIEPGRRVQLSFITAITDSRESAIALIEKYKDIAASHRAIELAWTYAELELRHLRVHQEEVQLFQKLASRLIYPHIQLRSVQDRFFKNQLGQSGLWAQGISGDLPIVVVTVSDIYDVDLVKQLLIAHDFWSLRGLKADLVIFNEEEIGYQQPLHEHLQSLVQAYSFRTGQDKPGGVFLRFMAKVPVDEMNLILCVARAILVAARGSLRQQLVSPKLRANYPSRLTVSTKFKEPPSRPLPFMELPYFNGRGGYTHDGRAYVIYLGPHDNTPAPWINVLANPLFGTLVSEAGIGCSWYANSQTNRLTPWSNDPLLDPITDTIYIRDEEMGTYWTPTPAPIRELDPYRISHGQGYSRFEHNSHGLDQELIVFVPVDDKGGLPLRLQRLRVSNHSGRRRHLTFTAYTEWVLGGDREESQMLIVTEWDSESQAIFATNKYNSVFGSNIAFCAAMAPVSSFTGDRTEFIGRNRSSSNPEALVRKSLSGHVGAAMDPCAALQVSIEIDPDKDAEVVFIMGYAPNAAAARQMILDCRSEGKIEELLSSTKWWWDKTLGTIQVEVPDLATNFFVNRWLLYQDLSCRFWGRSAFYQSSGAYGFRDQLQDTMALLYSLPHVAREYILKAASRQYIEGDVQHWWHPETGAGIRTRCSDDLLWLPFVTAHYVRVTGDVSILEETVSFLEGDKLADGQDELFQIPKISTESATLLEHCRRSLKKGTTAGPHGLPLIGSCDWNDGMNRVGIHGKGESVWLAWFLIHVMNDFADLLTFNTGSKESGEGFRAEAKRLAEVVEAKAWDGRWYLRAYYDDGMPLGSKDNDEASIDSLAQSWAVISGQAKPERIQLALNSAEEFLVKDENKIVLLLTPPFDKSRQDPGYIKGYPPGVRENGGQYTHGSSWLALAYARVGNGNRAAELLKMLVPTLHTQTPEANALYKIEPYAVAGDVYDLKGQVGRGGWSWYTGSAAWIYRIWLEEVLGFTLRGQTLSFKCAVPKEWDGFKLWYQYKSSKYEVNVMNPNHTGSGTVSVTLDGVVLPTPEITLVDDGGTHSVLVVIA